MESAALLMQRKSVTNINSYKNQKVWKSQLVLETSDFFSLFFTVYIYFRLSNTKTFNVATFNLNRL